MESIYLVLLFLFVLLPYSKNSWQEKLGYCWLLLLAPLFFSPMRCISDSEASLFISTICPDSFGGLSKMLPLLPVYIYSLRCLLLYLDSQDFSDGLLSPSNCSVRNKSNCPLYQYTFVGNFKFKLFFGCFICFLSVLIFLLSYFCLQPCFDYLLV